MKTRVRGSREWHRAFLELPIDGVPVVLGSDAGGAVNGVESGRLLSGTVPPQVNGFRIAGISYALQATGATGTGRPNMQYKLYVGRTFETGGAFDVVQYYNLRAYFGQENYRHPVYWFIMAGMPWEVRVLNGSTIAQTFWVGLDGWYF